MYTITTWQEHLAHISHNMVRGGKLSKYLKIREENTNTKTCTNTNTGIHTHQLFSYYTSTTIPIIDPNTYKYRSDHLLSN